MTESLRALCTLTVAMVALAGFARPQLACAQTDGLPQAFGDSFYSDHKAHQAGDVLTVLIVEESSATESAQTSTAKSDALNAAAASPTRMQRQWHGTLGDQFDGGGQIARSGEMLARLSVQVDHLDGNGNLWVHGEQEIKINGERQRIRLTGMVRPDDIGPENTVASWRIESANIVFLGKGVLGDSQSPGLLLRILRWLRLY